MCQQVYALVFMPWGEPYEGYGKADCVCVCVCVCVCNRTSDTVKLTVCVCVCSSSVADPEDSRGSIEPRPPFALSLKLLTRFFEHFLWLQYSTTCTRGYYCVEPAL